MAGYENDHVARIERAGKDGLVWTPLPLRARNARGEREAVSLELREQGDSYEPENPIAPIRISKRAGSGVLLSQAGVSVAPEAGAHTSDPERIANQVLWANVDKDTDYFVRPAAQGVETFHQLRSAESPEELRLRFTLPAGATLREAQGRLPGAEVVKDGSAIARISAPAAWDSDHEPVPVTYQVQGDTLVMGVDHRGGDHAYPILVDPQIADFYAWRSDPATPFTGWLTSTNLPSAFAFHAGEGYRGRGLYVFGQSNYNHYPHPYNPQANQWGSWGGWAFQAPGTAYVYGAQYHDVSFDTSPDYRSSAPECLEFGMWSNTTGAWQDRSHGGFCGPRSGYYHSSCVAFDCRPMGTPANYVVFTSRVHASGWRRSPIASMGAAAVFLSDDDLPTLSASSVPSGWTDDPETSIALKARDTGLGVKRLSVSSPSAPGSGFGGDYTSPCSGDRAYRCPNEIANSYRLASLPEGVQSVRAEAEDVIGHRASGSWPVKLDRSPPAEPSLSGALFDDRSQTMFSSQRDLKIDASDAHSGVKSIEVKVDGQRRFFEEQTCPASGCPSTMNDRTFRFIADDYEDGDHKVKVIVRDQLADQLPPGPTQDRHITTNEWQVTVDHRAGDFRPARFINEPLSDRMGARTNANNGNLLVEANDLNIAGLGMNLSISRYYNSRLAQTEGRLGFGWKLSVGRDFRIDSVSGSEDVRLYGANGFFTRLQHQAGQTGNAEFREPPGIDGELSKRSGGGYDLRLDGNAERLVFTPNGSLDTRVDRNNNQIKYEYVGLELRKITDTKGRVVNLTYSAGLLRDIHDTAGDRRWRFGYDEATRDLKTYTDPEGKATSYSYDAKHRLDTITDPNGKLTDFGYDISPNLDLRRIASVQRARGDSAAQRTTRFAYANGDSRCPDQQGNRAQDLTDVTDALGHTTRYCRDDTDGRVRRIFDARQNKRSLDYDAASANVTSFENGSGAQSKNEYEGRDLKSTTSAAGAGTTFERNGSDNGGQYPHFLKGSTDAAGNTLGRSYTSNGNLKGTTAKGGAQTDAVTLVSLDYNDQTAASTGTGDNDAACDQPGHGGDSGPPGTVRCSEDGNGNETRYRYSDAGNQKGNLLEKDPRGPHGKVSYTYDSLSRMQTSTDAEGNTASYGYDRLDRVTGVAWTRAGQSPTTTTYSYDPNGNRTARSDAQGASTYAFSARNQLLSESLPAGANHAYAYDSVGNLKSLTDAGGQVLYDYNSVNLVTSVVEPPATAGEPACARTTTFDYNAHNGRYQTNYPNGVVQKVDFEESQAAREANPPPSSPPNDTTKIEGIKATRGSEVLSDLSWSYQLGGSGGADTEQRRVMRDHRRNERTTYAYDHLNRLTVADTKHCTGSSDSTCTEDRERFVYRFDENSNRLESTDQVGAPKAFYKYNETNALCWKQLAATRSDNACADPPTGAIDYDYDLNGNLTAAKQGSNVLWELDYNRKDQTTAALAPGKTLQAMSYLGDTQQERSSRGEASFADTLLGLSSATRPGRAVRYTRGPGGELISQRSPEGRQYYLTDSIGSVVGLTHQSGTIANRYRYDPFGNTMNQGTEENVSNPFRFGGEFYDSEIKLYKQGLRFYDPQLGRWTQRDPLDQVTEPREANRYGFAAQDPVNLTDPSGADIIEDVDNWVDDNISITDEEARANTVSWASTAGLCTASFMTYGRAYPYGTVAAAGTCAVSSSISTVGTLQDAVSFP